MKTDLYLAQAKQILVHCYFQATRLPKAWLQAFAALQGSPGSDQQQPLTSAALLPSLLLHSCNMPYTF